MGWCEHGDMATVFTKIISGEFPGLFAWADDRCVVFASIDPITTGHLLVVPREEVVSFTTADDNLLAHLMKVAAIIGRAQEKAFDAPRAGLIVAGFEVPHLHVHVMPIHSEGDLSFANAKRAESEELRVAVERVRGELRAQGHGANVPADVSAPGL